MGRSPPSDRAPERYPTLAFPREAFSCIVRLPSSPGTSLPRLANSQEVRMSDPHLKEIRKVTPSADGCEDCLKIGATWVHLRLCLSCGHVGCCDSSPNRHATKHFQKSKHPIIQSFEPGEDWRWCYVDEATV